MVDTEQVSLLETFYYMTVKLHSKGWLISTWVGRHPITQLQYSTTFCNAFA
jgi:hypothetical protein